jgi:hypothetical protein
MSDDFKAGIAIIVFSLIVFGSFTIGVVYNTKTAQECKVKALEKNIPALEIMELCK